jgi:anaphase-promoting complex subunit 2
LPEVVVEQQRVYEAGYERLKSRRKLTWLNQMGQARVEIELRDRRVEVDCSTVEATVVYAFQRPEGVDEDDDAPPVRKSVDELYEQLQMDEDLITAALQFWVSKGVLRRVAGAPNTYVVAETLDEPSTADAAVAAATTEPTGSADQPMEETPEAAAKPGLSAKERERREIYWRYIQGMLTNASASMPLAQMAMMMKMLIADGFPWSNEELQDFLGEKVLEGEMEIVGGKYRLVKK